MKRRQFITLLGGAAAWPLRASAQQGTMPIIGYLSARSPQTDDLMLSAFRHGLHEGGYIEGRDVTIELRWAQGRTDQLPALAADLVSHRVTVIAATGTSAVLAAKAATTMVPIVFSIGGDPVKLGLVASLNRPGGNLTGVCQFANVLQAKRLGLLHDLVPTASIIHVLVNPIFPDVETQLRDTRVAAEELGQQIQVLKASNQEEIDAAFATLAQERAVALLVAASPYFFTRGDQIIALAARHSLPTMYFRRELVEAGGLMSYASTNETYRQLGNYAGKILSGVRPADLPVVQSTKFELVINLKTAKALGLPMPDRLLALADRVIE